MSRSKVFTIDPNKPDLLAIEDAAVILRDGGLVVIPTETVYGIAANMLNRGALDRLYEIKQRQKDKPFSLHIDEKFRVDEYARMIPVAAYKLIDAFWPGPLTLILRAKAQGTIGIRMPDNTIARMIIARAGVPVVCPSANISGRPAPVRIAQALADLDGLVDCAVDGGPASVGVESTIVDLTADPLAVIREGAIPSQRISEVVATKTILFVCTGNSCRSVMAEYVMRNVLKTRGRANVEVSSAGVMMLDGMGASDATVEILGGEGLDASGHRSRRITPEMLKKTDMIVAMASAHEERILGMAPQVKNRLFLLKEFAAMKNRDLDVPDPIGRPIEFYAQILAIIKDAVNKIADII